MKPNSTLPPELRARFKMFKRSSSQIKIREFLGDHREIYRFKNLTPLELRECLKKELPGLRTLVNEDYRLFFATIFESSPLPEDLRFWDVIHLMMQDYWLTRELRRWLEYLKQKYSPTGHFWFHHYYNAVTPWFRDPPWLISVSDSMEVSSSEEPRVPEELNLNRTPGDWHRGALAATSVVAK